MSNWTIALDKPATKTMSHPIYSHGPGQVPYFVHGIVPQPALNNSPALSAPVYVTLKYPSDSDEFAIIN
ncbi:MAG: hypothetical protein HY720_29085 [Planctomycetes bacterium]|nr:hypothetical protein [Planctomycetota bacterium]